MRRKYLVLIRAGKNSLHHEWLKTESEENRLWDLQISQYDDDPNVGEGADFPVSVDHGTKWDSILRFLKANPEVLEEYAYIMFPDDDVRTTCKDLNQLFETCEKHKLDLAQPSLHEDSYVCYPILINNSAFELRYTNFIECMVPVVDTTYLKSIVMDHLEGVRSGWGLDHVWALWMPDPFCKAAIIDSVSVVHTRPHATGAGGSIYAAFKDGTPPNEEGAAYVQKFKNVPDRMISYSGIDSQGRKRGEIATKLKTGINLIANYRDYREKGRAFRSGLGSILRILTAWGYKPKRVTPR